MEKVNYKITYNRPYVTGDEASYMIKAVASGKLSGNGIFTQRCQDFFINKYGFKASLLTNSCTAALEMSAILCNIQSGDEVIMPSFTFVSMANAFVLRGAKIVFADSSEFSPNIDVKKIESLITKKTKAIVVVHYAGISCDIIEIAKLAKAYNLFLIEDVAHSIDSYYHGDEKIPLGKFGDFATFSFHETKNVTCGEGGLLAINNENYIERAEIIWEKGTNRADFNRKKVKKYEWVDIGSSFLPSELTAAFLLAQLDNLENIQKQRVGVFYKYFEELKKLSSIEKIQLPYIPEYASSNGHLFYLVLPTKEHRNKLINYLKDREIQVVFHYQSLHKSPFYKNKFKGQKLLNSEKYSDCLVRLPIYYSLNFNDIIIIVSEIEKFSKKYL